MILFRSILNRGIDSVHCFNGNNTDNAIVDGECERSHASDEESETESSSDCDVTVRSRRAKLILGTNPEKSRNSLENNLVSAFNFVPSFISNFASTISSYRDKT